jgi:hypothetical protein
MTGKWHNPAAADVMIPRGTIVWTKGVLGQAGSIDGKPVCVVRKVRAGQFLLTIKGWMWDVTPDMGVARFNIIPGDKITETPCHAFKTMRGAKAEAATILAKN